MSGDERDERDPGPGTRDSGGVAEDTARPTLTYAPPGPEPRAPGPAYTPATRSATGASRGSGLSGRWK